MDAAFMPVVRRSPNGLQLHVLAYNLGDFLRKLATLEPSKDWSMTSSRKNSSRLARRSSAIAAASPFR